MLLVEECGPCEAATWSHAHLCKFWARGKCERLAAGHGACAFRHFYLNQQEEQQMKASIARRQAICSAAELHLSSLTSGVGEAPVRHAARHVEFVSWIVDTYGTADLASGVAPTRPAPFPSTHTYHPSTHTHATPPGTGPASSALLLDTWARTLMHGPAA